MRYKLFALLILAVLISGCTKKEPTRITILHWNDFHSANVPHTMVNDNGDTLTLGGIANLAGYLEHYREELKPTIEMNSGDDFQGTPISAFTKGLSQVKLLNVVKPDVFTVGNHEFDYGAENVKSTLGKATFPVLCGNVIQNDNNQPLFPADTILEVNGVKVGVIGVVSDYLMSLTTQKATDGVHVIPSIEVVKKSVVNDYVS